jgi:hypothetical protein
MIYFALVFIFVILLLFWFWLSQPLYHKGKTVSDFPRYIQRYIELGAEGAFLKIKHESSARFIQYVKYQEGADIFLRLGLPNALWSRNYYEKVISELKAARVKFRLL